MPQDKNSGAEHVELMRTLAGRRPSRGEIASLLGCISGKLVVRQTLLDGIPNAFVGNWAQWDCIRTIVSEVLKVDMFGVRLSGSANSGYKFTTNEPWDPNRSDLDLFIVSRERFHELKDAAETAERGQSLRWQIDRGFISTWLLRPKLPPLARFNRCHRHVLNYAAKQGLVRRRKKSVTFRVYENARAAERQLVKNVTMPKA